MVKQYSTGVLIALTLLLLPFVMGLWPEEVTLQTAASPDARYTAQLVRLAGLDRNYIVKVDGGHVFTSADFAPRGYPPYREAPLWDASGRIVVLEIARHRIFGYDVENRRRLPGD